jgi:CubicO group peptidase (beta-lactamase class C family)
MNSMHPRHALALLSLSLSAPISASAQEPFAPDSAVKAILADRVASKRGMGFVVAILERGKAPRIHTAGTSGVDGLALDANTVFEIGSITKVFTGTLLSEMVAKGEVKLDDPISKYLPATVRVPSRKGREITLLDLATQSSGLPRLPGNLRPASAANPYADYTVQNLYEFLSGYTLTRDIGSEYEYSNLGVGLLGHVLSLRAAKSYEALVRERVLAPLGMNDSGIELGAPMKSRLAQGFNAQGVLMQPWDLPTLAGAGALRSTAGDMLKFLAASLDSTTAPLGAIMSRARESRHAADRPGNRIGLGWHIVDVFGSTLTWHNGGTGGYRAFIGLDDARHRGVIVLSNSTVSPDDIGFHLLEPKVPLDFPAAPPPERKAIALDPFRLDPLVGVYELAPNFQLTITKEDGKLFGQATGQGKVQLHPESETKFFLRGIDAQVSFVKGADGKVNELILHQNGANIPGKRVQ